MNLKIAGRTCVLLDFVRFQGGPCDTNRIDMQVVKDIENRQANATALTIEAAKNIVLLAASNAFTG